MIARIATIVGVTAGGLALLVGGAVTATAAASGANPLRAAPLAAASPAPSSGAQSQRQASCQAFLNHLASDLGVSQDKLNAALKQSGGQTIDDAVKKGDLTQQQANQIKSKLSEKDACSGRLGALAGGRNAVGRKMLLQAAAQTLNTSPDQLAAELKQGKSISQVAPQGMTEQQFQSGLQSNLKSQLDSQVKAGKITQSQEDRALQRVPQIADHAWQKGIPQAQGKSNSPAGGGSPAPQATPSPGS
jgi:ribosomal protein S20